MHTDTERTMHETMHGRGGWVSMEDYAKLHEERCDLENALNAVLEAEGFDGTDQDAYWTRRNELMAAGRAWYDRMVTPDRKMTVRQLEARAKMLGVEPSELLEGINRTTAPVLGIADCTK
ncbi:MAG: hypothetical protein ACYCXR_03145 [Coriobacteriia bacterium]